MAGTSQDLPREIILLNEDIPLRLSGTNRNNKPGAVLLEDDRTLRTWSIAVGTFGGQEIPIAVESGGEQINSIYYNDYSPALAQPRVEASTGEQAISLYGSPDSGTTFVPLAVNGDDQIQVQLVGVDEAGNNDNLRTDPNRILWTRDFLAYEQVDPVEIAAAGGGVLYNPGATASELYEVSFKVVNQDTGGAVVVDVGVDIGGGGSLASPEYWMRNESLPAAGSVGYKFPAEGFEGPFLIAGDDDVYGVADVASRAAIHFRVRRVDVGA